MVGMFVNTVPVRIGVQSGLYTLAWLRDIQTAQSEAREYDHVSLASLGAHLFDSLVAFENYPFTEGDGPRIIDVTAVDSTTFALSLRAYLTDQLGFDLSYAPRLFDEASAQSLGERLLTVLGEMAADPYRPVGRLAWMTPVERDLILTGWSGGTFEA